MRNIVIIILLILAMLLGGIFTVDEHEVGVVEINNHTSVYSTGTHWKIPFYGKLTLVYNNTRNNYFAMPQPVIISGEKPLQLSFMFSWDVVDANKYIGYLNKHSLKDINAPLDAVLNHKVDEIAKNSVNIAAFMASVNQIHELNLSEFGVRVLQLNTVNVKFGVEPITQLLESSVVSVTSVDNNLNNLESSYKLAMQIKNETNLEKQKQQAKMKVMNSEFYDFFMKIDSLQHSAESKGDVPELNKIIGDNK